jgi:glycosyltransferase involved in cell wall biosynthesis
LKLLHVFSTFKAAGPQLRFIALAKQWGPQFRHVVLAMDGNFEAFSQVPAEISFERQTITPKKGRFALNIVPIQEIIRATQPDIVVTYNFGAIEWPMLYPFHRQAIIHVEDGFGPEEAIRRLPRRTWARRIIFRYGIKNLIVISNNLKTIAINDWKVPRIKLHHLSNGVDLQRFTPLNKAVLEPANSEPIIIGTICGLRAEKRLDRLIEALSLVKKCSPRLNFELWIAGSGEQHENLKRLAALHADQFTTQFLGSRLDTQDLLQKFDIFALSSDTEQAPLAILEAMATGLPIAAVDVGDVKSMVSSENAHLIEGRESESLATSIGELLNSPSSRRILGRRNREKCEAQFDFELSAQQWQEVLLSTSTMPL